MVRRFQSAAEREKQGREKGYSGVLEASLVRSEAKIDALQYPDPTSRMVYSRAADGSISGLEQDQDERAQGKEDGLEKWKKAMGTRFVRGSDDDFDYKTVDENDQYEDRGEEDRVNLDEYLRGEEEDFIGDGKPEGETGVQDF